MSNSSLKAREALSSAFRKDGEISFSPWNTGVFQTKMSLDGLCGLHKHHQIGQYSRHSPVNVAESTEDSGPRLPAAKFRDVLEIVSVLAPAHQEE
jgi:hypothetical protein